MQVGNILLGIPVRLIRKNAAKGSELGYMYIFDGLYNVVRPSASLTVFFVHIRASRGEGCVPLTQPGTSLIGRMLCRLLCVRECCWIHFQELDTIRLCRYLSPDLAEVLA